MSDKEITNEDILQAMGELADAMAEGFQRVEGELGSIKKRLDVLDERVGVLEAQHREVVTRIEQVPDAIDETYGRMLNGHEDRIRALEADSKPGGEEVIQQIAV